jgi:NAD(P)-dependent dehydrogenase (short-subunit alcohol dehydrogenase family)
MAALSPQPDNLKRHEMVSQSGRLSGKVAIVTGAGCVGPGWGNGRAIAVRFAQEGARVFAVDKELTAMDETLALIAQTGGDSKACRDVCCKIWHGRCLGE